MDEDLDAAGYDDLLDDLEADARESDAADSASAAWDAVGEVVPELTAPVNERVLEHAENDPDPELVAEVVEHRESDDAERQRARALTAMVADLRDRLAASHEGGR